MLRSLGVEHDTLEFFLLNAFTFKGKHVTKPSTRAKGNTVSSCLSH